jgi:hypothetical protein
MALGALVRYRVEQTVQKLRERPVARNIVDGLVRALESGGATPAGIDGAADWSP